MHIAGKLAYMGSDYSCSFTNMKYDVLPLGELATVLKLVVLYCQLDNIHPSVEWLLHQSFNADSLRTARDKIH